MKNQANTKTAIGVIFFSLLIFGSGFYYGNVHEQNYGNNANTIIPRQAEAQSPESMEVFWKAWEVLDEKFVPSNASSTAEVSGDDRVWGAAEGLAESYDDPYTTFLPPSENEVFEGNIRGEFGGVGMEVGRRNDLLTVISPLAGSPAEDAGVEAGDVIVTIEGETTEGVSIQEAVEQIRGEVGTEVTIEVLSENATETEEISIVRDTVELPTIETTQIEDTFVISLYNFSAQSADLFAEALADFQDSGADSLMIDLRGNTGGYLQAAVEISSHFLDQGEVVVREDFGENGEPESYRSRGYGTVSNDVEVGVLVNGGSASASEIVAGALRDHGVAEIFGTTTYGKGSVQELVELPMDTAIKVTVARWLTPDGISISNGGITPDKEIQIETPSEDRTPEQAAETQLEQAVEAFIN